MEIKHLTSGEALSHAAQVIEAALSGRPTPTPFGIIDPDYARIYSKARVIAWQYGYSCCAQGSFTRDLDLLLVPWTDSATRHVDAVVARIADVCELRIQGDPSKKPHGRKAWSLLLPGFSEVRWVDLSAFPPRYNDLTPRGIPEERGLNMKQEIEAAFEAWLKGYSTLPTERDDHGYADMTAEMLWHAWRAGVAHGRAQAASAAEETVRATIIVGGETPEELRAAISHRVSNAGKPSHWADGLCALQPPKSEG